MSFVQMGPQFRIAFLFVILEIDLLVGENGQ